MREYSKDPERPIWIRDMQALVALCILVISMAGGWTSLHNRVSINERDIAAEKERLSREIVIQSERMSRLEDYLIRIEGKIDRITVNGAKPGHQTSYNLDSQSELLASEKTNRNNIKLQ